ncbi:uncharacterized protein V3H82_002477 isoform 3-T3 [Fundulus diaphanus]
MTSPPLNTTSLPVSPTSPATNMTSPPLNTTSPSVSPTSPATNMTSPPLNTTSPSVSPTSPAANMTSPSLNATSPQVTVSSTAVNITSAQPMSTSLSGNATLQQTSTTSPQVNETSQSTPSPISQTSATSNVTSQSTLSSTISTTTTAATTTTTTPAPPREPKIRLQFNLMATFTEDLKNNSSPQFKELERNVTTALDGLYRKSFGDRFNRTVIKGFRQGSVVAETELIFNNVSTLPNTSDVTETLKNASSDPAFNLPVNTTTIAAEVVLAPTQPPTTTTVTTTVKTTSVTGTGNETTANLEVTTTSGTTLNSTSVPANTTSQPLSPTSPAANMTLPPLNTTSPSVSPTSPAANMTSPSLNATSVTVSSTAVNITSAQPMSTSLSGNATLQQTSTTSPQVNGTSQSTPSPISQTSATSNVTSQSTLSSTISTTTTAATTTTTTPAPPREPRIRLQFNLKATFTEDLKNNSSPQFKELERNVTTALDGLYKKRFGDRFNRTVIKGFRQGSVVAETELIFNNVSTLPNTSDVTETLKNASSDPAFNLPVNTTTIAAEVVLTPTQPPPTTAVTTTANTTSVTGTVNGTTTNLAVTTTAGTTVNTTSVAVNGTSTQPASPTTVTTATTTTAAVPADSRLNLEFRLTQPFDVALENSSSLEFRQLAQPLTEQLNAIYRGRFRGFLRALIRAFRRGSVIVDSELQFANASSVPETQAVADTLLEARNSSNFTLPLNTSSVVVMPIEATTVPPTSGTVNGTTTNLAVATTAGTTVNTTSVAVNGTSTQPASPTTVTTATTTTAAVPADSRLNLEFRLTQPFADGLDDSSSPVFRQLAQSLTEQLNAIYRRRFRGFLRALIRAFRRGSVIVDSELQFANASSVPETQAVADTLLEARNSSNFTLPLNTSSVVVTPIEATTVPPTTGVEATTVPPTTALSTTTAFTDPPAASEGSLSIRFSLNRVFTAALTDTTSSEFIQLASTVITEMNRICSRLFLRFSRSRVNSFTSGSVVVNTTVVFRDASSVPSLAAAQSQLAAALLTSNLDYINGTLVVGK